MDGSSVFFDELAKLLEQELSGSVSECVRRDNNSHLTLVRQDRPSREVQVNFGGSAAFLHWNLPGGTEGPFLYSDDGKVLTRGRDNKQFTVEEFANHVLLVLRT